MPGSAIHVRNCSGDLGAVVAQGCGCAARMCPSPVSRVDQHAADVSSDRPRVSETASTAMRNRQERAGFRRCDSWAGGLPADCGRRAPRRWRTWRCASPARRADCAGQQPHQSGPRMRGPARSRRSHPFARNAAVDEELRQDRSGRVHELRQGRARMNRIHLWVSESFTTQPVAKACREARGAAFHPRPRRAQRLPTQATEVGRADPADRAEKLRGNEP